MGTPFERLKKVLNNCTLVYKGQIISYYSLLKYSANFYSELVSEGNGGRGIILHPGSDAELVLMTVLSAFKCILDEESSQIEVINNLNVGDKVVYEKSRGIFLGVNDDGYAKIQKANSLLCYVPRKSFYKIMPYRGNATTLDGRGLRDKPDENLRILGKVLGVNPLEIPSVINKSIVVVCHKQEADSIIKDTLIMTGDGEKVCFCSLFPSAYYTPNDVHYYPGNSAKLEPVIKFTGRISVARELIIEDREKNIICVLVNGRDIIDAGISELKWLLLRKSLKNVLILSRIDDGDYRPLLKEYENLKLFSWTKEAILSNCLEAEGNVSGEVGELSKYVDIILDKKTDIIKNSLNLGFDCNKVKNDLIKISKSERNNQKIISFVINGYSLLKLFTYAIFPIKELETYIEKGLLDVHLPQKQLGYMNSIAEGFDGSLGQTMINVYDCLFQFYEAIYFENPKFNNLIWLLQDRGGKRKRTAIIIPKPYYETVFRAIAPNTSLLKNCEFVAKNKFNNENLYDRIIVTGVLNDKNYNIFRTNASLDTKVLVYPFEEVPLQRQKREYEQMVKFYDRRNYLDYEFELELPSIEHNGAIYDDLDGDLKSLLDSLLIADTVAAMENTRQVPVDGQSVVEVVRLATFVTGERAFFTKHYSPYILDAETGNVIETEVSKLAPGDVLIFAKYNDDTLDIVDKFLRSIVNSEKCDLRFKESYRKSVYWKDALRNYIRENDLSFKEVSDKLEAMGHGKHEVTIRSWLDSDSHIIGPRDPGTFSAISRLTGDKYLLSDPDAFWEACNEVRAMRVKILKLIGWSIVNSAGGMHSVDEYLQTLVGDLSNLAVILQIDHIVETKDIVVPAYLVNRPQKY